MSNGEESNKIKNVRARVYTAERRIMSSPLGRNTYDKMMSGSFGKIGNKGMKEMRHRAFSMNVNLIVEANEEQRRLREKRKDQRRTSWATCSCGKPKGMSFRICRDCNAEKKANRS